jgi:hypothetical protein
MPDKSRLSVGRGSKDRASERFLLRNCGEIKKAGRVVKAITTQHEGVQNNNGGHFAS